MKRGQYLERTFRAQPEKHKTYNCWDPAGLHLLLQEIVINIVWGMMILKVYQCSWMHAESKRWISLELFCKTYLCICLYTCTLTQTGFEVLRELITLVTAADRSKCAVLTVVWTVTVIWVTTINNLYFNTYRESIIKRNKCSKMIMNIQEHECHCIR